MNKSNLCLLFSALGLMLLSTAAFAELAYIDPVTNRFIHRLGPLINWILKLLLYFFKYDRIA